MMDGSDQFPSRTDAIIKLAVMAVGGQGGGVLTNWIEDCARAAGYHVQATSVAGVAQRTGATIYYIEMAKCTRPPIFALAPAAGDVDILIAAEMMEAGRAILRGFVTPDRTTLIASTHRALAVSEKTVPGDGMANSAEVMSAAQIAAQHLMAFDMEAIALRERSVISASLFGALAGAEVLPFSRPEFEAAIRRSGRAIDASLAAFGAAYDRAQGKADAPVDDAITTYVVENPAGLMTEFGKLEARINGFPEPVQAITMAGLRAVVDFQDLAYGREYLDRIDAIIAHDDRTQDYVFTQESAKYLARAMAYDDVIRVADLKTRASRFARIEREMLPPDQARMKVTEFMHPRAEELVGLLPARLGGWISNRENWMRRIDKVFNHGRRVRSDRLLPFTQLYLLAGLRRWRRGMLRHKGEMAHLNTWLDGAIAKLDDNYDLAVELIRNRRLIKGYSDTHTRGLSKFDRVNDGAVQVVQRPDAADWVRRLREAALADANGDALDGALKTVASFADGTRT